MTAHTHAQRASDATAAAAPTLQRACACGKAAGVSDQCAECAAEERLGAQPKLRINPPDDHWEKEADRIADRVVSEPRPVLGGPLPVTPIVQRQGPEHEGNGQTPVSAGAPELRRRIDETAEAQHPGQAEARRRAGSAAMEGAARVVPSGSGRPLSNSERTYFEPRLGQDFSGVRIHEGAAAHASARALGARAFTIGSNIVVGSGKAAAEQADGRWLMAHELVHTAQQKAASRGVATPIQRLTHGPSTPTNCHNWRIPLPPWTAGTLAHLQAAAYFTSNPGSAGYVLPEVTLPRGTKALMGVSAPPAATPPGFMDLIGLKNSLVEIGEIKSTYSAASASPQAAHYLQRHNEWLDRAPWISPSDAAYEAVLGGGKPGELMSGLASVTGTGTSVGQFIGDPLKTLHLEADDRGAIAYWCTGVGTTNPAWARVFSEVAKAAMKEALNAYRAIQNALDELLGWVGDNPVLAFAILLCLALIGVIVAVLAGILEIPSGGLSTPALLGGLALAVTAGAALLAILGIDAPNFGSASARLAASLEELQGAGDVSGDDYERGADSGGWSSTTAPTASGQIDQQLGTFIAAAGGLPAQLSSYALDIINPLSSRDMPRPTPDGLETARRAANTVASNSDPEIASIGQDALAIADRIDLEST